jgi:succinate-acetate transporter protein
MGLGNPAPLGLLAFGTTTLMLMYVEMGWVELETEGLLVGYAIFFGGVGQVIVAIFEMLKGSSFSFAVFGSYGFFWLGWGLNFLVKHHRDYLIGEFTYQSGQTAMFVQWGVLTFCFWTITLRKNIALIIIFFLLFITFFLLAIATARENGDVKKAAGYFGFFTACGAFYTGVAELVNEEWGREILPGLAPIHRPERLALDKETIRSLTSYDKSSNTLLLYFRGLQINSPAAVEAIREGVESSILEAKTPNNKVHVVADYKDVSIASDLLEQYWTMANSLERKYYLSVRRFAVTSFGTRSSNDPVVRGSITGGKSMDASRTELVA